MKTATVRDLRNQFRRISKWLDSGESVQVVKHGKPFARVIPEPRAKTFVGACPSSVPLPSDLDQPVVVPWDAEK